MTIAGTVPTHKSAVVTHVAGPLGTDRVQRCARCRCVLKDLRSRYGFGLWPYPEGAYIDRGPNFQAVVTGGGQRTLCPVQRADGALVAAS